MAGGLEVLEVTALASRARVWLIESRVWSILASRLVNFASSSANRDSVEPGSDGSSESPFLRKPERGSLVELLGVARWTRLRESEVGSEESWQLGPEGQSLWVLFCPAVRAATGSEAGGRRKTSGLTQTLAGGPKNIYDNWLLQQYSPSRRS